MHELLSMEKFEMSRFLTLQNIDTGTIDICFDDSDIAGENNFSFMKRYGLYECKIKLFGKFENKIFKLNNAVLCVVQDYSCIIGKEEFVMVKTLNDDKYYIPKSEFKNGKIKDKFYFSIGRKDLIQVSQQLHSDYI